MTEFFISLTQHFCPVQHVFISIQTLYVSVSIPGQHGRPISMKPYFKKPKLEYTNRSETLKPLNFVNRQLIVS